MTTRGGWLLRLRCAGCGARGEFRHYILPLARDNAASEGWTAVEAPSEDGHGICPTCSTST